MKLIDYLVDVRRAATRHEARKIVEAIEDWAMDQGAILGIQNREDARDFRATARVLDQEARAV